MNERLTRAALLMEHARFDEAAAELAQQIGLDPEDWSGHAMLAWCLIEQDRHAEALEPAERAAALAPNEAAAHHVRAVALANVKRHRDAMEAIREAIRLDPDEAEYRGGLAAIHTMKYEWRQALEACEQGLALDPDDALCQEYRTIALNKLGRPDEASAHAADVLRKRPNQAVSHANAGWAALHAGDHKTAKTHFLEALRLEPGDEYARAGAVEALKAKNPVYRLLLHFQLWMASLSPKVRLAVVIGGYFVYRGVLEVQRGSPGLAPWLAPLVIAYLLFALLTIVGAPFFNLLLLPSTLGRRAMSRDQTVGALVFGGLLGAAIVVGVGENVLTRLAGEPFRLPVLGIMVAFASIPAGLAYQGSGRRRVVMLGAAGVVLLAAAGLAVDGFFLGQAGTSLPWVPIAVWTAIGSIWASNFMASKD